MPSVHIRDLPQVIVDGLKRRAKRHHRSLQGELHAILEEAARATPDLDRARPLDLHLSASKSTRPWTREDMYDDRGR
jgi:plasmid stability protein